MYACLHAYVCLRAYVCMCRHDSSLPQLRLHPPPSGPLSFRALLRLAVPASPPQPAPAGAPLHVADHVPSHGRWHAADLGCIRPCMPAFDPSPPGRATLVGSALALPSLSPPPLPPHHPPLPLPTHLRLPASPCPFLSSLYLCHTGAPGICQCCVRRAWPAEQLGKRRQRTQCLKASTDEPRHSLRAQATGQGLLQQEHCPNQVGSELRWVVNSGGQCAGKGAENTGGS